MTNPKQSPNLRLLLIASASSLVLALSAGAQEVEDDDAILPTVTVTAQKVEQNVQDVPISVSAVSGAMLENSGTTSLENIGDLIPSVTFRKGTTNANSALVMRGVGTITFSVAAEPSVSTVVDGIVLSRSGQAFIDLVDIQRLEALRGPQGTLFGKNASAGLVNIVSKGGSDTLEGELKADYFEGEEYRLRATLAGPIGASGALTGRLTGFYGTYDGNITNVINGTSEDINGYERQGVRALVDFDNGGPRLRLIADYFESNDDCCAEVTGVTRGAILDRELGGANLNGINTRTVSHNLVTESLDQQTSLTADAEFDVAGGHTLSLIAGWRKWENTELREGDFLPLATTTAGELHDRGEVATDQYSLEARLASDQASAFRYQIGGFAWRSENAQDFTRRDITCTTSALPIDPVTGARPCDVTNLTTTLFPSATSRSDVTLDNYAVFGQADYDLTDKFTLTAGLRFTQDELDYVHTRAPGINLATGLPATGPGVSGNPAGGTLLSGGNGTNTSSGTSSNDNVSGKVALNFKPTDDVLLYGSFTRGYKGPAFNVFFNHTAPTNAVPIDEEVSDSYEVGLKSRFADDRAQLNLSVFNVVYDGFQANNFILLNNQIISNLTNAGQVESSGFELDFTARATDELTLYTSIANADAKVKRFNPNPLTNAPDARNGTQLPLAPEWSYNLGGDFERDLGAFRVYASAVASHTGDQFSDLGESGPLESYTIVNASLGFSDPDDRFRLTFHGRNLGDEQYVLLNTSAGQRLHIPRDADRYWGVSLRAKMF